MATVVYPGTSEQLALPLFGDQGFSGVTLQSFARLAKALQEAPEVLMAWAAEDVERIMDAWATARVGGLAYEVRLALERHHASLRADGLLRR